MNSEHLSLYKYCSSCCSLIFSKFNLSVLVCFQGDPGARGPPGEPVSTNIKLNLTYFKKKAGQFWGMKHLRSSLHEGKGHLNVTVQYLLTLPHSP